MKITQFYATAEPGGLSDTIYALDSDGRLWQGWQERKVDGENVTWLWKWRTVNLPGEQP